jgi:crotonobetainyl-CoA hydratase
MLMTGRRMGAAEAARWGLVNQVVLPENLQEAAQALASRIAQGAPLALAAIKEVLAITEGLDLPQAYLKMRSPALSAYPAMLGSRDAVEGPLAFAEKRAPRWRGK